MIKKGILFIYIFIFLRLKALALASLHCSDLTWCWAVPTSNNGFIYIISEFISQMILYTAVLAVIALMISWIMYMLSMWEEEKTKKAKKWIIWSLIWVIISVSAWFIINSINNLSI